MMYQAQRWYELFCLKLSKGQTNALAAEAADEAYRYMEARRLYPELPIGEAMTAYLTRPT